MSAPSVIKIEEFPSSVESSEMNPPSRQKPSAVAEEYGTMFESYPTLPSPDLPVEQEVQTSIIEQIEAEPPNVQYEEPSLVETIGGAPAVAMIATTVGSAIIGGLPYLAYELGKDIVNVFKDKSTDKDKIITQPVVVNPQINNVFSPNIEQKVSQRVEQQQRQQIGRLRAYRRRATKQKK